MKSVYEIKENSQSELKVTVDGEKWSEAQKKAFNKISANIELKGFRKGKAPEKMVRAAVSEQQIMVEAAQNVAQEALEFGLDEHKEIKLIDRPTLDIDKLDANEAILKFLLTVYPEVTLGDYKAVKYEEKKVSVVKKDVDDKIQELLKRNAEEVLKESGKVKKGDIAVIDFEGFVDGVAFDGGKGTEYPLEIGSGSFIPGFEDQVIGMKTGDEKDINVTFPHEYMPELADKAAVFKVKVDGIKEKKLPELTDEFVAEAKVDENVKTVEELNKFYKEQIKEQRKAAAEEEATNALLDKLCEVNKVDIPEVMINNEVEDTLNNYKQRMAAQKIPFDTYLQIMGTNVEDFKAQLRPEAQKKVNIRLVLEAIGTDMKVEASEKDLAEEYEAMAKQYNMEVEKIKELVPADYLSEDIKMKKTLESLKKNTAEK